MLVTVTVGAGESALVEALPLEEVVVGAVVPPLLELLELLELSDFELVFVDDFFFLALLLEFVPGELPPVGTRLWLNWPPVVDVVVALALALVVVLDAVPQPASSAAVASTASDAAARRGLSREPHLGRDGASLASSVSISANDTV